CREEVEAGEPFERFGKGEPLWFDKGVGGAAAKGEMLRPRGVRRLRKDSGAVGHQRLVRLTSAVPFDQGEFRMMQRATLAVAERFGEFDDAVLAGRQQLLAGELRRSAEVEAGRGTVRRLEHRSKGVQVGLVT